MTDATANAGTTETPAAETPAADAVAVATGGAVSLTGAQAQAAAPIRPEGLADEFWTDKGLNADALIASHKTLAERAAAFDARAADVPGENETYELKVSDAVKLPDGFTVDIDTASPFFTGVSSAARAAGMTRAEFQPLVDAYAAEQIAAQAAATEVFAAEKTKLGENAAARIEAVRNRLAADKALAPLADVLFSAAHIQAVEKLIAATAAPTMPGQPGATAQPAQDRASVLYPEPR